MFENEDISRNYADDEPHTRPQTNNDRQIDDLPYDCFENIFKKLDLRDLTQLSSANTRLHEIGNFEFHRMHGTKKVRIRYVSAESDKPYAIDGDQLSLYDFKLCVTVWPIFRASIKEVCIDYTPFANNRSNWIHVMRSIFSLANSKRSDKLTSVQLINCPVYLMNEIRRPMENITIVHMANCEINAGILNMAQLFPNVQQLRLIHNKFTTPTILQKHFPKMKQLVVEFGLCNSAFDLRHLSTMLQLNGQIEKLEIDLVLNLHFVKSVSEYLPGLKCLSIMSIDHLFTSYHGGDIHFENVCECELPIKFGCEMCQIPITFKQLVKLKLLINGCPVSDAIIDFIVANPSIVVLELATISYGSAMEDEQMSKILNDMPLLEHFTVAQQFIRDEQMVLAILESKSLKTFCVRSSGNQEPHIAVGPVHGWNQIGMERGDVRFNRIAEAAPK